MSTSNALRPAARSFLRPSRLQSTPPTFLLPSLLTPNTQTTSFSTSTTLLFPRDKNRDRGVSTVRRSGLRQPLSVSKTPLPKPVLDDKLRSKVVVDDNHGLWDFFHSKDKPMNTPEEDFEHGRPWSAEELRRKSWEDLHCLWWVCCKERNRIATEKAERVRLEAGYGEYESKRRDIAVRMTQRGIKQVLTERFYAWQDAQLVAKDDAEVNLSGRGRAYIPSELFEEEGGALEEAESVEAEDGATPEEQIRAAAEADSAEGQLKQGGETTKEATAVEREVKEDIPLKGDVKPEEKFTRL